MLNLFMQVPAIVRTRLAKRCKEVYECMHMVLAAADDGIDDVGEDAFQVRTGTRCTCSMHWEALVGGSAGRGLFQRGARNHANMSQTANPLLSPSACVRVMSLLTAPPVR
jgi:hypothetical protein